MAKRVRDWRALDAAHRRRGESVTIWLSEDKGVCAAPKYNQRTGAPRRYSDAFIEALLTAKLVLRLSLRAVEGFAAGLAKQANASWVIPDYTTLCRRERTLEVDLGSVYDPSKRHVLVVDSTGLKVFGEGEWKVRVHGVGKRRTWRKIHLLVDRESGQILSVTTTENNVGDSTQVEALLPPVLGKDFLLADGAYHTKDLHRLLYARGATLLSPPPKNARRWRPYNHTTAEPALQFRNAQLTPIKRLGRTAWKIKTGCSQRSFVESTNHRLKSITGDRLSARTMDRQKVEVRLRCSVLNRLAIPSKVLAV